LISTIKERLNVFENGVPGRVFGPKKEGIMGGWRKLHNEELHNLYCSLNIIRIVKSRRVKCVGYVACMGEMRNAYKILF
jgi:hypothetical protein